MENNENVVTERMFEHIGDTPDPYVDDMGEYEQRVVAMIVDAENYENDFLRDKREENVRYYDGLEPFLDDDEGRSTFVSTDVKDTIMGIIPSLVRIFASGQDVAEFIPSKEEDDEMAKQCLDYLDHVFYDDNEGFLILYGLFKDALTLKTGIVKWWTKNTPEVKISTFSNLSPEMYQFILSERDGEVEIAELVGDPNTFIESLSVRHVVNAPRVHVAGVPPEEFRIARNAKSVKSSKLVGHQRIVPMSELVEMGYDPNMLENYITSDYGQGISDERYLRNEGLIDNAETYDGVPYGEYYVYVDKDGDGIDELRLITTVGDNFRILSDTPADYVRFAVFGPDPVPHTLVGDSVADSVKDIQRIKTNMMRATLDNLADVVRPRTVVNETLVNLEDALNPEQSAVIRTKGDPSTTVMPIKTPFVGGEVFEMTNQLDSVRASRTGITEASKGLDPKAMQSTALAGIDAIVVGAQERIELIARIMAETGWKDMMQGILKEVVNNPNPERVIKLRGKWVKVDPSTFDPDMRIKINPTLGKGSDMTRLMALREVKATQEMIIGKWGIKNPVVGPTEYRNTVVDMLALVNVKNPGRYFKEITPDMLASMMNAPEEPSPEMVLAGAEMEKIKADVTKTIADMRRSDRKDKMDDDYRRDKLNIDTAVKIYQTDAELAIANAEMEAAHEQEQLSQLNTPNE